MSFFKIKNISKLFDSRQTFLKVMSSFFSVYFLASTVLAAAPPKVYSIKVPEKYGKIQQRYRGKDARTIVHVQDAHASFEAQKNISEILNYVAGAEGLQSIAVEGAVGSVDLNAMRSFPLEESRNAVAEEYVKEGKLTAAELCGITSKEPVEIFGAEDFDLFQKNFSIFYNTVLRQDDIIAQIEDIESVLDDLRAPVMNSELQLFFSSFQSFAENQSNLMQFMPVLFEAVRENIGDGLLLYPELSRFKEVLIMEQRVNFQIAREEMGMLRNSLEDKLQSKSDLDKFRQFCIKFDSKNITEKEFAQCLRAYSIKVKQDLSAYRDFTNYLAYLESYSRLNFNAVMRDTWSVSKDLIEVLSSTNDESRLSSYCYSLLLLRKLCSLQATGEEVAFFNENPDAFNIGDLCRFAVNLATKYGVSADLSVDENSFKTLFSSITEFYDLAEKRNHALINKTLLKMQTDQEDVGVLLGGGYHTDGIVKELRKQGINYIVVTPSISSSKHDIPYLSRMTGQLFDINASMTAGSTINALANFMLTEKGKEIFAKRFTEQGAVDGLEKAIRVAQKIKDIGFDDSDEILSKVEDLKAIDAQLSWDAVVESVADVIKAHFKGRPLSADELDRALSSNIFEKDVETSIKNVLFGDGEDKRLRENEERREKYGRILRDVVDMQEIEALISAFKAGRLDNLNVAQAKMLIGVLRTSDPFGEMFNAELNEGECVLAFQVPGISSEDGLYGIKELNDNKAFGEELTNKLIALRRQVIAAVMTHLDLGGVETRIKSNYKEDIYAVARTPEELDAIVGNINSMVQAVLAVIITGEKAGDDSIDTIAEALDAKDGAFLKERLLSAGVDIQKGVFALDAGIGVVRAKTDKVTGEDKMAAVIDALQAIVLKDYSSDGSAVYSDQDYSVLMEKIDQVRQSLISAGVGMFDTEVIAYDDYEINGYRLKDDIGVVLRKRKAWTDLKQEVRDVFNNNEDYYKIANEYFGLLNVQDFMKTWELDAEAAEDRSEAISDLVERMSSIVAQYEGQENIPVAEIVAVLSDINVPLLMEDMIFTDPKNTNVSSKIAFHGRAPPLERPGYITIDIKNMGVKNNQSFERELQIITEALSRGDWKTVNDLKTQAADDVTRDFMASVEFVVDASVRAAKAKGFDLEKEDVLVLIGGDEATFVFKNGADIIDFPLLHEIRRSNNLRVAASVAVDTFREEFRKKESKIRSLQLGHAQTQVELEKGIKLLKDQESIGEQGYVALQMDNKDWKVGSFEPEHLDSMWQRDEGPEDLPWNTLYSIDEIQSIMNEEKTEFNMLRFAASVFYLDSVDEEIAVPVSGGMDVYSPLTKSGLPQDLLQQSLDYLGQKYGFILQSVRDYKTKFGSYKRWMESDFFLENYIAYDNVDYTEELETFFGEIRSNDLRVLAHGVSGEKAGLSGFLNLILEGELHVDQRDGFAYFAKMTDSMKTFGPYYIVMDRKSLSNDLGLNKVGNAYNIKGNVWARYHKNYVVPNQEVKELLINALRDIDTNILKDSIYEDVVRRIVTYDEFIEKETSEGNLDDLEFDVVEQIIESNLFVDGRDSADFSRLYDERGFSKLTVLCKKSDYAAFYGSTREIIEKYEDRPKGAVLDFKLVDDADYDEAIDQLQKDDAKRARTVVFVKDKPEDGSAVTKVNHVVIKPDDEYVVTLLTSIIEALILVVNDGKEGDITKALSVLVSINGNLIEFSNERMRELVSDEVAAVIRERVIRTAA